MWMEISACLFAALVFVVVRYERREKMTTALLLSTAKTMALAVYDRRASRSEPHVPGQGEML